MDIAKEKAQLVERIEELAERSFINRRTDISAALADLAEDIRKDFFLMVVLGEFKCGKSTFVNALIGERLLPADVLPTTAVISALMYERDRSANIIYHDGKVEKGQVSLEYLSQFSAGAGQADPIKYIEIGLNADILKNRLVIVDTPGVSDINEQRVKVTYDFIPKANAVIFLLDAGSPLKKSEKDFISNHLVPLGLNKILFVVNKFDDVDEEEEDDLLQDLQNRLTAAFKMNTPDAELKEVSLLPLSSLWALSAIERDDQQLLEQSGFRAVKDKIQEAIFSGEVAANKLAQFKTRLVHILSALTRQLQNEIQLKQIRLDHLQELMTQVKQMQQKSKERRRQIASYAAEECQTILAMTDKSLVHFHAKLKDSVNEQISYHKGSDFKEFIEQRLLKQITKEIDHWLYTYSQYIEQLMMKLEHEFAEGLARHFQQNIHITAAVRHEQIAQQNFVFALTASDVSNTTLKAGLVTAGGAGLAMLIGSTMLLPFISMAAFPYLQKNMLERKLQEVKNEIIPAMNDQLIQCMYQLRNEVRQNIQAQIDGIQGKYETAYDELIMKFQEKISAQIQEASGEEISIQKSTQEYQEQLSIIVKIKMNIEGAK